MKLLVSFVLKTIELFMFSARTKKYIVWEKKVLASFIFMIEVHTTL